MKEDTGRSITLNGYEILQAEVSSHHQASAVCSEINRCVSPETAVHNGDPISRI